MLLFLLLISYIKTQHVVNVSCLCLPVAAAAGGQVWPTKSFGNPFLYLWPSFPHGRTGKDSDGRSLSLAAEAMVRGYLECVLRVIYHSTYVGLNNKRKNLGGSSFLMSNSKIIVITTSTMLRQLVFHYEESVRNPQTLVPLECWDSQHSLCAIRWGF